jgi:hypothetical protein
LCPQDDDLSVQNPNPVLAGSFIPIDTDNTLRGAWELATLIGPLYINTAFSRYWRVQPESAADLEIIQTTNLRPAGAPALAPADVKIVSTNVLK